MAMRYIILNGIKTAEIFDDSNGGWPTTGLPGEQEFGWQYILFNEYNIYPYNRAQGSTGYFTAINNVNANVPVPATRLMVMRSGYNDVKVAGFNDEHAKSCLRAMVCSQFLASAVPASDAGVTKTGTWTAESLSTSKANNLSGTPMKSSTSGDKISFVFTGTNVVVFVRHSDGIVATYGSVRVTIDGSPAVITGNMVSEADDEYSMNAKAYNVTTSGGFIYGAFQVKGLTNASHTIELELLSSNLTIIDSFAQMAAPASCIPCIIGDVCHDNTGTAGRNANIDSVNTTNHALLEAEFLEYLDAHVLAYVALNDYVDEVNTTDDVHFNLQGHKDIAIGIQEAINE